MSRCRLLVLVFAALSPLAASPAWKQGTTGSLIGIVKEV